MTQTEWIKWCKAKEILNTDELGMVKYISEGLQPYSQPEKRLHCPESCHKYNRLWDFVCETPHKEKWDNKWRLRDITDAGDRKDDLIEAYNLMQEISETDPDLQSWEYFVWPESPIEYEKLMERLKGTVFRADEIEQFKKDPGSGGEAHFVYSEDYRTVCLKGQTFNLTRMQSMAIEFLHQAHQQGTPEVSQAAVLEHIESLSERLKDVFKSRPGYWGKLVGPGKSKGTVRQKI